jgi:hypothetical protein
MTAHVFPTTPDLHNDRSYIFRCTACVDVKRTPAPQGPVGPYDVGIPADEFPTCEAVREEQARRAAVEEAARQKEEERRASHARRLAEFQSKHLVGGYFWVRGNYAPGSPPFIAFLDDERRSWQFFGDGDDDGDDGQAFYTGDEYRGFDCVTIVAGPIRPPPTKTGARCTHGHRIDGKGGDPDRFRCTETEERRDPLPNYCLRHYRDSMMSSVHVAPVVARLLCALSAHIELLERQKVTGGGE